MSGSQLRAFQLFGQLRVRLEASAAVGTPLDRSA